MGAGLVHSSATTFLTIVTGHFWTSPRLFAAIVRDLPVSADRGRGRKEPSWACGEAHLASRSGGALSLARSERTLSPRLLSSADRLFFLKRSLFRGKRSFGLAIRLRGIQFRGTVGENRSRLKSLADMERR
jgi:hypothetical protein